MNSTALNIVGIVQARMGASRLPNKMMLALHGYPVVEWIFRRCKRSVRLNRLVFAIPDGSQDDVLAEYLKRMGATVFRGSESDVLQRFWGAAQSFSATHVVRICADNPLICPEAIDHLVERYFDKPCDYIYNHIPKNNRYPDGLGAEMVNADLLDHLNRKAVAASQREHVFNYIWDNTDRFQIRTFDPPDAMLHLPDLKLDLDTHEDYLGLIRMDIHPEMTARQIVAMFNHARKESSSVESIKR